MNKGESPKTEKKPSAGFVYIRQVLHHVFISNWRQKALAFFFALILFGYIQSQQDQPIRKLFPVALSYQSVQSSLAERGFVLVRDVEEMPQSVTISVYETRNNIQRIQNNSPISARLIYTNPHVGVNRMRVETFTQGATIYTVDKITPDYIEVEIDEMVESAQVPVKILQKGALAKGLIWDGVLEAVNENVEISGPRKLVERIANAQVEVNLVELGEGSLRQVRAYTLVDVAGNPVESNNIDKHTPGVTIRGNILSSKEVPIYVPSPTMTDLYEFTVGTPRAGYVIDRISPKPATVMVYGRKEVLDLLSNVKFEPVDVQDLYEDRVVDVQLIRPEGIAGMQANSVSLEIVVKRMRQFTMLEPKVLPDTLAEDLVAINIPRVSLELSASVGDSKAMNYLQNLQPEEIELYIDCTGLKAGAYGVEYKVKDLPEGVNCAYNPGKVQILIVNDSTVSGT